MNQSGIATLSKNARARLGNKNDVVANGFIHLAPRTHDTSLTGEHIPDIAYLAADLQASVQAVWPSRHEFRYAKVEVLLLNWKDDDLGVATEVAELQKVFEDLYRYHVQSYQIPNLKPDKELKRRMLEFLDNDGADNLLIVYYAGHAKKSLQLNEAPTWFAHRDPKSPSLPSGGVQSLMEEADSDVLLLYDCCNAAATSTSNSQQDQQGVTEAVAACGYEDIAPEVGEHSFTNALMETLAAASKGVPFSIGELHNRILNRLKCWVPSVLKDEHGKVREDANGRLEYERQPRRTPIYSLLVESKPRRSILLAPLPNTSSNSEARTTRDVITSGSSDEKNTNEAFGSSARAPKRKRSPSPDNQNQKCSQVILSVQLYGDALDIQAWKECIRLFPAEAKNIKVEGIYDSFSTLLLLRMPVAVWNLLPDNRAYNFVGYVTSENQVTAELPDEYGKEIPSASTTFGNIRNTLEVEGEFKRPPVYSIEQGIMKPMSDLKATRLGSGKDYRDEYSSQGNFRRLGREREPGQEAEYNYRAPRVPNPNMPPPNMPPPNMPPPNMPPPNMPPPNMPPPNMPPPNMPPPTEPTTFVPTGFIHKLHNMLADPKINHLISWSSSGNSFVLCPSNDFSKVLAEYFNHRNIATFVRQLNMYGFCKVSDVFQPSSSNIQLWEFKHSNDKFKRGDLVGLRDIKRGASRHALVHRDSYPSPTTTVSDIGSPASSMQELQPIQNSRHFPFLRDKSQPAISRSPYERLTTPLPGQPAISRSPYERLTTPLPSQPAISRSPYERLTTPPPEEERILQGKGGTQDLLQ